MHTSSIERRPSAGDSVTRLLRRAATTRILLHYETEDSGAHAEVTYCYRPGERIVLDDGRVVAADKIRQGNRICLEDGGTATVTASKEISWEAYDPALPPRIIGTVKYRGFFQRIDFRVAGGATIGTTPEHAFWSVHRQAWKPISSFRIGETLLAQDGQTSTLEWISDPYTEWCELRNIEIEQVHRFQVGTTPQGGLWTHNGLDNSCRVPRAKTVGGIDEALHSGRLREVSSKSRVIKPAPDAEHHVFLQHLRKWFKNRYGIDVDDYVVDVDDLTHQALHAGRGPLGIKAGWWEQELLSQIQNMELLTGRKLNQGELLAVGDDLLSQFNLPSMAEAHRYTKAKS